MSSGEMAYLILVISGALVFMATLGWVSRRDGGTRKAAPRRSQLDLDQGHPGGHAVHSNR